MSLSFVEVILTPGKASRFMMHVDICLELTSAVAFLHFILFTSRILALLYVRLLGMIWVSLLCHIDEKCCRGLICDV